MLKIVGDFVLGHFAVGLLVSMTNLWGPAPLAASQQGNPPEGAKELHDQWANLKPDPDFLTRYQQKTPLVPTPQITDLEHTIIKYHKNMYYSHPRMGVFKYFGGDEIVVGHAYAASRYQVYEDVRHKCIGARAIWMLQRSTDGGQTWPEENQVILPGRLGNPEKEQLRAFLFHSDVQREKYDMFQPESLFYFTRTEFLLDWEAPVCFALRSPNKGHTWESVPTIIHNPLGKNARVSRHNTPVIRMPDGETLLISCQIGYPPKELAKEHGPAIFYSKDQGLNWHFLARPIVDLSNDGFIAYSSLLLMPNGDIHCYYLNISDGEVNGLKNAIAMSVSKDKGKTWSEPVPIVGKGAQCWKDTPGYTGDGSVTYRSPWPLLLKDGRVLVIFARREMPAGIGGVISADAGQTWSAEFVIRDDAKWWDLGYPVACQLDDGRVFVAYYYNMLTGGRNHGGTRHVAGSFFRIAH